MGYFWATENFAFPDSELFGEYRGRGVRVTYCLDYNPPIIKDEEDNKLTGIVRGFVLDKIIRTDL